MERWNDYAIDFYRSIQHDIEERVKYQEGKDIKGMFYLFEERFTFS